MTTQRSHDLPDGDASRPAIRVRASSPRAGTRRRLEDNPVQIGNWDLVRMLGSGSDADVFLAQHRENGRKCAVKLVRHDSTSGYDRRRHLDEIRAIIAIDHRNVVRLYEAGELDDRRIYLVMEYLEGTTLRKVIDERGPLGASVLLQIGLLVARGLGAAHARGIVHRDLKPSNVMVIPTSNGRFAIKLIDFGIAKFMDGKTSTIVGTPAYMSPEAVRGDALDHRTDIYSFGVMLHRASTGGYPDRDRSSAFNLGGSKTPIRNPSECTLQTIIERCLRRDPVHRFPTTAHLIAELETARARLKGGLSRPPRGTPTDDAKTSWWLRDDTVFATGQTVPPRPGSEPEPDTELDPEAATSQRIGVLPLPLPAPRPSEPAVQMAQQRQPAAAPVPGPIAASPSVVVAGPAITPQPGASSQPRASARANETSGLLVVPPPGARSSAAPGRASGTRSSSSAPQRAQSPIAPAMSQPTLEVGPRRRMARRMASAVTMQITRRARLLIGATIALGVVLGAVIPIATRDADPPATVEVATPPPPPPAAAPPAPPPLAHAACTPPEPERAGPPSRAVFAAYSNAPDEARPARAKTKRRVRRPVPVEEDEEEEAVEIKVDDDGN